MGDSAITIIGIFLAAILMFVFPLMMMADKKDNVSSLTVQIATNDFVNRIRKTGILTQDEYNNFARTLVDTGNPYNIEITVRKLDDNPNKKRVSEKETIGDNVYYTMYTTQVLEEVRNGLVLKEGDIVSVDVKNKNVTIAQQLRNFLYRVTGQNAGTVLGSASGIVTSSGI